MPSCYRNFRWGSSFLAIGPEFWPWQIEHILCCANESFERRPHDEQLQREEGVEPAVIPLDDDTFGYDLALVLCGSEWTLEVTGLPRHAAQGERIRAARRKREREERRRVREAERRNNRGDGSEPPSAHGGNARLARRQPTPKPRDNTDERVSLRVIAAQARTKAVKLLLRGYKNLNRLRLNLSALLRQIRQALAKPELTVREQLLRWVTPSLQLCAAASIEPWVGGARACSWLERHLFDFGLPMWLNTFAPDDGSFVRGGVSVFGEQTLESEWVL